VAAERYTAIGVFDNEMQANEAFADLQRAGFGEDQIGFIRRHRDPDVVEDANDVDLALEAQKEAAEGAVGGALAGAGVGGLLGAAAALLIPGIGPVVAGGIIATAIGGATVGAAAGGVLGALVEMGIPDEEAEYYEQEFQSGRTVLTVHAPGRVDEALRIMRANGATERRTNVDTSIEERGSINAA
jgi:hypothetical protein